MGAGNQYIILRENFRTCNQTNVLPHSCLLLRLLPEKTFVTIQFLDSQKTVRSCCTVYFVYICRDGTSSSEAFGREKHCMLFIYSPARQQRKALQAILALNDYIRPIRSNVVSCMTVPSRTIILYVYGRSNRKCSRFRCEA